MTLKAPVPILSAACIRLDIMYYSYFISCINRLSLQAQRTIFFFKLSFRACPRCARVLFTSDRSGRHCGCGCNHTRLWCKLPRDCSLSPTLKLSPFAEFLDYISLWLRVMQILLHYLCMGSTKRHCVPDKLIVEKILCKTYNIVFVIFVALG